MRDYPLPRIPAMNSARRVQSGPRGQLSGFRPGKTFKSEESIPHVTVFGDWQIAGGARRHYGHVCRHRIGQSHQRQGFIDIARTWPG